MNMATFQQSWKEDMYEFFRDPNREKLREVLQAYDAENNNLDFKLQWIGNSKLAKHILAFANSGGGAIVFGIKENSDGTFQVEGLEEFKDKADIAVDQYIPEELENLYEITEFEFTSSEWDALEEGLFQVMLVDYSPVLLPFFAQNSGKNVDEDTIYIRDNSKSIEAGKAELENLINRRVKGEVERETGDLRENIAQLRTLCNYKTDSGSSLYGGSASFGFLDRLKPAGEKDFERYISSRVEKKKKQIDDILGI